MKIKVLLVDDHYLVSEGLKMIIETDKFFQVIGNVKNGEEAIKLIEEEKSGIDLIITDLNMPVVNGIDLLKYVKKENIEIPVIIFTAYNEEKLISKAMEMGAAGYLLKGSTLEQITSLMNTAVYMKSLNNNTP